MQTNVLNLDFASVQQTRFVRGPVNNVVVETLLTPLVVRSSSATNATPYALYVFHGTPASPNWWTGRKPLARFRTIKEAFEAMDDLTGLRDSIDQFPMVHDRRAGC